MNKYEAIVEYGPHYADVVSTPATSLEEASNKILEQFKLTRGNAIQFAYISHIRMITE